MSLPFTLNKGPCGSLLRAVLLMIWNKGVESKALKLVELMWALALPSPARSLQGSASVPK